MDKEKWEKAKALYFAGQSWETIANDLQLNRATLQQKASLEGITKVKAQMQTICKENKIQNLETLSALVRNKLAADAASTLERLETYDLSDLKDESTREQILGSVAKRSALVFGWSESGEQSSVSINILGALPDRSEVRVEPSDK